MFICGLEVPATFIMPAVTIEFDRVAGAFTLCATVFAARLRRTGTARILALILIVRHGILPEILIAFGKLKSNTLNQFYRNLSGNAGVVL